jgi:hypothetical protein
MSAWQPIETAPRDGAWFLGYWPEAGVLPARITPTQWEEWTADGARFVDIADHLFEQPTHWMPLPEPPLPSEARAQQIVEALNAREGDVEGVECTVCGWTGTETEMETVGGLHRCPECETSAWSAMRSVDAVRLHAPIAVIEAAVREGIRGAPMVGGWDNTIEAITDAVVAALAHPQPPMG